MNTKVNQSYEPRLVSEYVLQRWPSAIHMFDVPLGPVSPDAPRTPTGRYLAGVARTSRPRADAIVIASDALYVVEGKIIDVSLGAGKLPMYARLVPSTPELKDFSSLPVKMVLISANPAQWSAQAALIEGIELVVYTPDWAKDYMQYRNTYFTADARRRRLIKKQFLESAGFRD